MYDHDLFVETTAGFSEKLLSHYEIDEVLLDLGDRLRRLFSLAGSGVTLGSNGQLHAVATVPADIHRLELFQEEHQEGPCVEAYRGGEVVAVPNLALEHRWPGYRRVADEFGMRAVAGVPMRLGEQTVGALNMYSTDVRKWSDEVLDAARVLANMATAYLINASSLAKQTLLSQQLQHALDSRVVIEQAKGILAEADGITVDAAFERLRHYARSRGVKVRAVASAVVSLDLRL
ncbi:GAF and ANTAR domain-containing protein [Georgenia sp. EYE_87]|uniref:GAF and ANTAR domain-containing protein n=1 Tax=Georgenia sp. EYE_87 TaxID=2853448 RepID=UPI002002DF4D|nr:GAF and ANTAR domain-containing protein [Georgenia sp. EYE_87]MCK6211157.1 GAF and ANTAR domain-containing protein [Georgenia sp. EYE_87]